MRGIRFDALLKNTSGCRCASERNTRTEVRTERQIPGRHGEVLNFRYWLPVATVCFAASDPMPEEASKRGRRPTLRWENEPESYPHSTQWTGNYLKTRIWNSAGSAMAYVDFAQILYGANGTSGPSDPKIKPRK